MTKLAVTYRATIERDVRISIRVARTGKESRMIRFIRSSRKQTA